MDFNLNLKILRKKLKDLNANAILVSMHSAFENTDLEISDINFISGFSGSNGRAIVSEDAAILSVDGRYTKQAKEQTTSSIWDIELYPDVDTLSLIKKAMKRGQTLAVGEFSVTYKSYLAIKKTTESLGINLLKIKQHPIVEMKEKTPSKVSLKVASRDVLGESVSDRLSRIKENLGEGEAVLLADKITIGWAFGIRRTELTADKSVLANCIALITKSEKPILFCDLKLSEPASEFELKGFDEFEDYVKNLKRQTVDLDFKNTPAYFALLLEGLGFELKALKKGFSALEAVKNETEIEKQKRGARMTSLAFIKTLAFAESVSDSSELAIAEFFEKEIKKNESAIGLSFNAISAFSKNTAIVHYSPVTCGSSEISGDGLFLFDAGAHFKNSTTDMTRTIFRGTAPSEEFKRIYSIVLKSLVMFSSARFPENSISACIDTIARFPVWKAGYDYAFGTGHGVGCFGNVHEAPRISQTSAERITKNMILTVEPGIYNEDFGIRIENMLLTKKSLEYSDFLEFETITFIPFCRKLIDKTLLDESEVSWLNSYHQKVFEMFKDDFKDDQMTLNWLRENTQEI